MTQRKTRMVTSHRDQWEIKEERFWDQPFEAQGSSK